MLPDAAAPLHTQRARYPAAQRHSCPSLCWWCLQGSRCRGLAHALALLCSKHGLPVYLYGQS